ncbi:MAG: DNA polymerase III subunit delta' [Neomegalonema sp.]|nr:DNA polymerase III subunit delta' [Neomegalonema sp.]
MSKAKSKAKAKDQQEDRPKDADRLEGVRHPRETAQLIGQEAALAAFDRAFAAGRVHHAWLLTGPRGVGKATAAYAIARKVLADQAADPTQVATQLRAGSHPCMLELRRAWNDKTNKFRGEILVDDVRRLTRFFGLSAADGGWRVVLVDPAEDMNVQAMNALLKALEEPPAKTLFLLTCHAPGRLAPTVLSRCRRLKLGALGVSDAATAIMAAAGAAAAEAEGLARLAEGAPGEALRLRAIGGLDAWRDLCALHEGLPKFDRRLLDKLMTDAAGRAGAERFETLARLWPMLIERIAATGARRRSGGDQDGAAPEVARLAERLAPDLAAARHWAGASSETRKRLELALALNLDPERTILDTALMLEETASAALRA